MKDREEIHGVTPLLEVEPEAVSLVLSISSFAFYQAIPLSQIYPIIKKKDFQFCNKIQALSFAVFGQAV